MSTIKRPVIGIPTGREFDESKREFHAARVPIVDVARVYCDAIPFLIPALADGGELIDDILDQLDGLFVPGGRSNVHPDLYGASDLTPEEHDLMRDATSIPLIRRAVERGIPVLAVCRGHQEFNVAFGGTLHQMVQDIPGKNDHRQNGDLPVELRMRATHPIALTKGGLLARLSGKETVDVNSSHMQAVDKPGEGIAIEAVAEDGIIEAISKQNAKGFTLGVQWHPEAHPDEDPLAEVIFNAFAKAVRDYAATRR